MIAPNAARVSHQEVAALIGQARLDLTRESMAQADLYAFLAARLPLAVNIQREVRLNRTDRVDLLIDDWIAVEMKLNAARPLDVIAQLERYATHSRVGALILASNRAISLPAAIGGKPACFVSLGRAWL